MTLQEAIEYWSGRIQWQGYDFTAEQLAGGDYPTHEHYAIATILNAVVKGELK